MSDRPFELRVIPRGGTDYGLALHREPAAGREQAEGSDQWPLVVRAWGTPLKSVMDQVLAIVRDAGYRSTDMSRTRQAPFELTEVQGVRLGLLLLAVKPLRKVARMSGISGQIQGMTDEEAYYWFSKSTAATSAGRAQRAMRVLLAED